MKRSAVLDEQGHFPDYRIEYELDGRELHQDVELLQPHYRGAHAASGAKAGFRIYVVPLAVVEVASGPVRAAWRNSCDHEYLPTGLRQRQISRVSALSATTA